MVYLVVVNSVSILEICPYIDICISGVTVSPYLGSNSIEESIFVWVWTAGYFDFSSGWIQKCNLPMIS